MKIKKVVKYPSSIGKMFHELDAACRFIGNENSSSLRNIIGKSNLPKKTKFLLIKSDGGVNFQILLPTGEIFGGVAIKDDKDKDDFTMATVRAAGRAIAVYKRIYSVHGTVFRFSHTCQGCSIYKKITEG